MFNQNDGEKKLDWMYKGATSLVDREEYLMGRAVDKSLEQLNAEEKQRQQGAFAPPKNHVEHECIPPSIRDYKLQQQLAEQVDLQAKLQEDPLLAIKKHEEETRRQFLQNPVQLKKLQEALSKQDKKSKKKHKDLDRELHEKLRQLKGSIDADAQDANKKGKKEKDLDIILMHKFNALKSKLTDVDLKAIMDGEFTNTDDSSCDSEQHGKSKPRKKKKKREHKSKKSSKHKKQKKSKKRRVSTSSSSSSSESSSSSSDEEEHKKKQKKHCNDKKDHSIEKKIFASRQEYLDSCRAAAQNEPIKKDRSHSPSKPQRHSSSKDRRRTSPTREQQKSRDRRRSRSRDRNRSRSLHCNNQTHRKTSRSVSPHHSPSRERKILGPDRPIIHYSTKRKDSDDSENETRPQNWGLVKADGTQIPFAKKSRSPATRKHKSRPATAAKPKVDTHKRQRLTSAERQRLLDEMKQNADERNEERARNIKKHREDEANEENRREFKADFAHKEYLKSASVSTVESRIKANLNNIQRGKSDMNTHFSRRY